MRYLDQEEFYNVQTENFVPLKGIRIDNQEFEQQIEPYKPYFRNWGVRWLDKMFRKGLPVVNDTGRIDDAIDASLWPLDQYNKVFGVDLRDNNFRMPTPILDLPCFDTLAPIKPYMIRSAILWWKKGSYFHPHSDSALPTPYIRLWGTNKPEKYVFDYTDGSHDTQEMWDAGQIYLSDTVKQHYAESLDDDVYTYFFSLDATGYDIIKELTQ
jgi:hypothetical protein